MFATSAAIASVHFVCLNTKENIVAVASNAANAPLDIWKNVNKSNIKTIYMENKDNTIKVHYDYDRDIDYDEIYNYMSEAGTFIHNAIKSKYDILEDTTIEGLPEAVLNINYILPIAVLKLNYPNSTEGILMHLGSVRGYKGKEIGDNTPLFRFSLTIGSRDIKILGKPTKSIVFFVDGERLEAKTGRDKIDEEEREVLYTFKDIYGAKPYFEFSKFHMRFINFELNPNDIKRIAEANNVQVCVDPTQTYDVNGGVFKYYNENTKYYLNYQIEGIQGLMKRAYHYFVDESCFGDYCSSYDTIMQKRIEEYEQIILSYREKNQQDDAEEEKELHEIKKKYNIILLVSAALLIPGLFVFDSGWLCVPGLVGLLWGVTGRLKEDKHVTLRDMFTVLIGLFRSGDDEG